MTPAQIAFWSAYKGIWSVLLFLYILRFHCTQIRYKIFDPKNILKIVKFFLCLVGNGNTYSLIVCPAFAFNFWFLKGTACCRQARRDWVRTSLGIEAAGNTRILLTLGHCCKPAKRTSCEDCCPNRYVCHKCWIALNVNICTFNSSNLQVTIYSLSVC